MQSRLALNSQWSSCLSFNYRWEPPILLCCLLSLLRTFVKFVFLKINNCLYFVSVHMYVCLSVCAYFCMQICLGICEYVSMHVEARGQYQVSSSVALYIIIIDISICAYVCASGCGYLCSESGVPGSCEWHRMGTGNPTPVLWKSIKCSSLLSHLFSPPALFFLRSLTHLSQSGTWQFS